VRTDSKIVFVVDDDDLILRASTRILQARGYAARAFSSARECLSAVSVQVPDCIVSDLQMPGMDGAQLIEQLRALGVAVPVILATAAIGPSVQLDRARRAGAYRILRKPHSIPELLDALAGLFAGKAGSEESGT